MTVPVVRFTVAGTTAAAPPPASRAFTVVYDGDCRVCTRLARVLRSWDRRCLLEIVPSRQPGVMARFPWIPARAYAEALQLIRADGATWQGAAAVEKLLDVLPRGRLLSWIFRIPFVRTLADRFYRWFARHRYQLGCGAHCQARPSQVLWEEAERAEGSSAPRAP